MTRSPTEADLARIRADLDQIDADLIHLLARRVETGLEAGVIKRALSMPIHDESREALVIAHAAKWAQSTGLPVDEVEDIVRRMIKLSRDAQDRGLRHP